MYLFIIIIVIYWIYLFLGRTGGSYRLPPESPEEATWVIGCASKGWALLLRRSSSSLGRSSRTSSGLRNPRHVTADMAMRRVTFDPCFFWAAKVISMAATSASWMQEALAKLDETCPNHNDITLKSVQVQMSAWQSQHFGSFSWVIIVRIMSLFKTIGVLFTQATPAGAWHHSKRAGVALCLQAGCKVWMGGPN